MISELAGLLARLTFCGLPAELEARQWQRLQKVLKRFTAAGTAPVLHRIPFSDEIF
jgi:hypothetical protein